MYPILISALALGGIALISAIVLYAVSRRFAVSEDARLESVVGALPGANCGGCGFPGCSGLAMACLKELDETGKIEKNSCPVGGSATMTAVGKILGIDVSCGSKKIAVVRCNGTCENRPQAAIYDSHPSCSVHNLFATSDTLCSYGCLGGGDCVKVCSFDAIRMNKETGLPEVDASRCGACGACAEACPRDIIEIRAVGAKDRFVTVSCVNKARGSAVVKACKVSCVGCGACQAVCKFSAITIENNLAYIDADKCKMCRLCVDSCPRKAIVAVGFPQRKKANEELVKKV